MKLTYVTNNKLSSIEASDAIFGAKYNERLVKDTIVAIQSNRRANTAHSKDRAAVQGADTKPWRQKGTGRARHGSIYSPIWRGGGVTFGPLNLRNYDKKVNRKARNAALRSAMSKRAAENAISVVDMLDLGAPKTKDALSWLETNISVLDKSDLFKKTGHAILVVAAEPNIYLKKSLRNIPHVRLVSTDDINVEDAMLPRQLLFVGQQALDSLEARLEKKVKETA